MQSGKRFAVSLRYNGSKSFSFVEATKVYQFKAKNSEINNYVSTDFTINNMEKLDKKEL